jgi:hypothetical protein
VDEAVDAGDEASFGGGESGVNDGSGASGKASRAGGLHDGFGEEKGSVRIAAYRIVIGGPVGGRSPRGRPGIAYQRTEAGKKTHREELPVIAVEDMGSFVIEGDGEGAVREATPGEQIGGDDDERLTESEECDGVGGRRHDEDGRAVAMLEELTGAAAGAGEVKSAQGDAESAKQRGCDPQNGGEGEQEAEGADAFGFTAGLEADVGRNTCGRGEDEGGEEGSELDAVEDAFTAAGGGRFETAKNKRSAANEGQLQNCKQQSKDDEEQADETQGPGEGHGRPSFFERDGWGWPRAERMLDSSWSSRSVL